MLRCLYVAVLLAVAEAKEILLQESLENIVASGSCVAYRLSKSWDPTHLPDLSLLFMVYRDRETQKKYTISEGVEVMTRLQKIQKNVLIYIHGYEHNLTEEFIPISDAYINQFTDSGIMGLDSSALIGSKYERACYYVSYIGRHFGKKMAEAVHFGLDPSSIHLIGHSLGAHISGFAGQEFTKLTGLSIGRISGLDPAGPCFSERNANQRLNPSNADYVDVIHTNAGGYGTDIDMGHANYFPNGGREQPRCSNSSCNHQRAWQLYAETFADPLGFPAVRCQHWNDFQEQYCDFDFGISYMGYASSPCESVGRYFLQTASEAPYGLGKQGLYDTQDIYYDDNETDKWSLENGINDLE